MEILPWRLHRICSLARWAGLISFLLVQAAPAAAAIDRVSEVEPIAAGEAWEQAGFRIQLRGGMESLHALGASTASDQSGISFAIEPGVRLGSLLSLSTSLRYALAGRGLRWTTTLDLSLHGPAGLFVSVGGGYAGLLSVEVQDPARSAFPLECTGSGAAALARAGWLIPMGEVFATGPVLQSDLQWTRCAWERHVDGEIPEDWVSHRSLLFTWSLAWR